MRKWHAIFLIIFLGSTLRTHAQAKPPLRLIRTIPLPGFEGGDFDHFNYNVKDNRLYLAAEAHKTVEVFNLRTGERIHSITGFVAPHAIICPPDSNKLIVTDEDRPRGIGWIKLVNTRSYQITDTLTLPGGADVAVFDPVTNYAYVRGRSPSGAKSVQIAIIDTKDFKHIGDITLPGYRSEQMAIEKSGKRRLFVSLTGTNEVGVVDLQTRKVIARWPLPEAHLINALTLDEVNHRVFIACRNAPRFFAFDTETGKIVANLPLSVEVLDDMSFDAVRKRIYVAGGPSTIVFEERDPDHYEHIAEIPTGTEGQEGKTARFVPELNRYYVALSGEVKPAAKVGVKIFQAEP
jgi:DNA-binding beta-propeller fold protein YncE